MNVRKNRIAVITQNTALAEFFQLEAKACGCSILVMEESPATLRDFERVVLDASVGSCVSDHPDCLVAAVSTEGATAFPIACDERWEWPVSIRTVRDFFDGSMTEIHTEREFDESTIYLLSREKRELLYRNRRISLTPNEWRILLALGERKGETVSREYLGQMLGIEKGNMADVYIHHLRKKLESAFGIRLIHTVRAQGYRLDATLTDQSENPD